MLATWFELVIAGTATPDLLVLDNGTADPTGVNGGMYYSTGTNKFRCYENGAWVNCRSAGSDLQHAALYDTNESPTNIPTGGAQITLGTISLTPTTALGDVYVTGWADVYSGSGTDQPLQIVIETTANCTGATVGNATVTYTITSSSSAVNDRGTIRVSGIAVDVGTSAQPYSLCAAVTSGGGDSDILNWGIEAIVIDTGADLAEIYTTRDSGLEAGDVVSLDSTLKTGVKKSSGVHGEHAIGIVSTRPGSLIGGVNREGVGAVPVALSGRVPVKVTTENGSIHAGDYLALSSTPGVATKSIGAGLVIGEAMESYEGEGVGMIMAFAKNLDLGEEGVLLGEVSANGTDNGLMAIIQTEIARDPISIITSKIASGEQFLTDFVSARVTAIRGYFDEVFTKKVHTEQLCVKKTDGTEICVDGDQLQQVISGGVVTSSSFVPVDNSSPAPVAETVAEPVVEPVIEPVTEPIAEPIPEAIVEPVMEPVVIDVPPVMDAVVVPIDVPVETPIVQ